MTGFSIRRRFGGLPEARGSRNLQDSRLLCRFPEAPRGQLPSPSRSAVPAMPAGWRTDGKLLSVRIVTEKMLQKTRGCLAGGFEVPAAAELKLSMSATLEDLKQQVHQSLRIPAERQLLFQIPDSSDSAAPGCSSWLVPVQSPVSTLVPMAVAHGLPIAPTVLLMFQSNDADPASISSMMTWHATGPAELPDCVPMLCRYFSTNTLSHSILGVLFASPDDSLLQHLPWLQKRIALSGDELEGSVAGPGGTGPLAASLAAGPGQELRIRTWPGPRSLRLDRPLRCQIFFGAAVDLEVEARMQRIQCKLRR